MNKLLYIIYLYIFDYTYIYIYIDLLKSCSRSVSDFHNPYVSQPCYYVRAEKTDLLKYFARDWIQC